MTKEEVLKGLECCTEFLCGECPYKEYDSKDYLLRCTHMLLVGLKNIIIPEAKDENNLSSM